NVTLKTAGTESVTVTDTATTTITGAETGIVVTPLATSQFSVTGASGGVAGTVESVTVTAEDAYGNRTTGYAGTVRFTSSDPRASLPANSTLTLGTGTFSVTLVKSGSQSITVTDTVASSLTGSETGIAIAAGDAAQFPLTGLAPHVAGVTQHLTVKAEDFYGNVATSYPGTIHFTSSDPNAILPPDSTLTNGVGTFDVILNTIRTQTVTVSDNTVDGPTGSETGILVTLGPVSQFAVTGLTPDPAGTSQSMIVKAEDAGGNLITGYSGTVHFTSSDSQAVLPADSTLTNGVGSFTVTLKTAGTQSVTATDTVTTSIAGTETGIAVTPASATHFTVTGLTGGAGVFNSGTAGTGWTLTVTAEDPYGNTDPSYTGTVHFTSSDPLAVLPADSKLTDGVGSFT